MQWVQPKLVAEVAFTERTSDGILRQASFMGLRQDIAAKSVGEEKAVAPKAKMCPKCGMVFETEEELQQHLREQHPPEVTSAPDS